MNIESQDLDRLTLLWDVFLVQKMKTSFAVVLLAVALPWFATADELIKKTESWKFPQAVYAQVKIVPTGERGLDSKPDGLPPREVHDWNGPWKAYVEFQILVTFNPGKSTHPDYDDVQPSVGLEGWKDRRRESHSEGIRLFNGPSAHENILVQPFPIEGTPELDKEYRVAALSSDRETLAWDVYVRFQMRKPDYAKN